MTPRRPRLAALLRFFHDDDRLLGGVQLLIIAWYVFTKGIFQGKASGDGFFGFMYLPGLVYFHTFDIAPNVPFWVPYLGHEKTGHVANACPVGPIIFWFPTYLLGLVLETFFFRVLSPALAALHVRSVDEVLRLLTPGPQPGQTGFDFWMAGLGSLFAGLAGVATLFRLLRRKVGTAAARVGVVGGIFATPMVFYLVTQPLYQHATAFFCVTLFVERWDFYRSRGPLLPRQLALLGALGGLCMEMRIQESIFLLLPGLDVARQGVQALLSRRWRDFGRDLFGGLAMTVMALLLVLPQLALWHWFFGELRTPQPPGHMRWADPALLATLFSMRAGIFPWMPIAYLIVPGLWLGRRPLGVLAGPLAALFLVELWVNASAWDHWGSWAFGPRRFTDATVTFAAGIAGLWWWVSQRPRPALVLQRSIAALIAFFVLYNTLLHELVRRQMIKSSGAQAFPASQVVAFAGGPRWLMRAFDAVGYPFVQPVGWLYALAYHAPVSTFEGVVGNYLDERDCRIHGVVQNHGFAFESPGRYVVEGIAGPADNHLVPVGARVRVQVPMFAREPVDVMVTGQFGAPGSRGETAVSATWNGVPLVGTGAAGQVRFKVPRELVRSRALTNEVILTLPPSTKLQAFDVQGTTEFWREPTPTTPAR